MNGHDVIWLFVEFECRVEWTIEIERKKKESDCHGLRKGIKKGSKKCKEEEEEEKERKEGRKNKR